MISAEEFFTAKLTYETDASDLYEQLKAGENVVVVDVRSDVAYAQGHVKGAIHLPYRDIQAKAADLIPAGAEVVVYCWSPGCNAGAKGAREFARAGYLVREMIGGWEYWVREGYPVEDAEGVHRRPIDPLTGVPRLRSVR